MIPLLCAAETGAAAAWAAEICFWAFWLITLLTVAVTVVRRAFHDTQPGHYHRRFLAMSMPEGFREREKLQRVAVLLSLAVHLLRVVWVCLFIPTAWYRPAHWDEGLWWTGLVAACTLFLLAVALLELVPQVIVGWRGKQLALGALPLLCRIESFFSPLTRALHWLQGAMLRFLGSDLEQSDAARAEEGIRAAVEIGEREGVLKAGEKSMIESVLDFHDAEIVEVMTPRTEMVCFDSTTPIESAIPAAIDCGHSRIPVYRQDVDHIIGVLYVKDLLRHVGDRDRQQISIESIVRTTNFVPESKKLREMLAQFRAERFHIAIVLDEYGGTSGLVTIEDILEEIVGDIQDEYDQAALQLIRKVSSDTFDLDGRAHIDDINDIVGAKLPECDDYETLSGFLMSSLGRVPREGDHYEFDGYAFKVTSADPRKVKRVRVRQLPAS